MFLGIHVRDTGGVVVGNVMGGASAMMGEVEDVLWVIRALAYSRCPTLPGGVPMSMLRKGQKETYTMQRIVHKDRVPKKGRL